MYSIAEESMCYDTSSPGYRSAAFLASLFRDVEAPSGSAPLVFDKEEYDYGNNYNTRTGVYIVPYSGLYLIDARVYGFDKQAHHFIRVDGVAVTYTYVYDRDASAQSASTSIVLHLLAGQEVTVEPRFGGTIVGSTGSMVTSFGATLLYVD